mgnify:CR=1 FL=1
MSVDHIRRGARIPHYLSPLSFAVAVAFSPTLLAADSSIFERRIAPASATRS